MIKTKKLTLVFSILLVCMLAISAMLCTKNAGVVNAATFFTVDGIRYSMINAMVVGYTNNLPSEVTIPSAVANGNSQLNVVMIDQYAFENATMTKVSIPDSVTTICQGAFKNCSNLVEATIGSGWDSMVITGGTIVNVSIFNGCSSLKTLTILAAEPVYVWTEDPGFGGNNKIGLLSMGNLNIGGVVYAGANEYDYDYVCAVDGTNTLLEHIYVPAESVDAYKDAPGYSAFEEIIEAIPQGGGQQSGGGSAAAGTGLSAQVVIPSLAIITLSSAVVLTSIVKKKKRI